MDQHQFKAEVQFATGFKDVYVTASSNRAATAYVKELCPTYEVISVWHDDSCPCDMGENECVALSLGVE